MSQPKVPEFLHIHTHQNTQKEDSSPYFDLFVLMTRPIDQNFLPFFRVSQPYNNLSHTGDRVLEDPSPTCKSYKYSFSSSTFFLCVPGHRTVGPCLRRVLLMMTTSSAKTRQNTGTILFIIYYCYFVRCIYILYGYISINKHIFYRHKKRMKIDSCGRRLTSPQKQMVWVFVVPRPSQDKISSGLVIKGVSISFIRSRAFVVYFYYTLLFLFLKKDRRRLRGSEILKERQGCPFRPDSNSLPLAPNRSLPHATPSPGPVLTANL